MSAIAEFGDEHYLVFIPDSARDMVRASYNQCALALSEVAEDADGSRERISASPAGKVISHRAAQAQLIDPSVAIQNYLPSVVAKLLRLVHPRSRDRCAELLTPRDLLRQ